MPWRFLWAWSFILCCATSANAGYKDAYDGAFQRWAKVYRPFDDWRVLKAQGVAESQLNPLARNPVTGALGLMQFMPGTAKALGVNPLDPESSIQGAAMYDAMSQAKFQDAPREDQRDLALASYDAGPGTVQKAAATRGSHRWAAIATLLAADVVAYVARVNGLASSI